MTVVDTKQISFELMSGEGYKKNELMNCPDATCDDIHLSNMVKIQDKQMQIIVKTRHNKFFCKLI